MSANETTMGPTTLAEVRDLATIPVWSGSGPCAARLLGIGRSASYEAARRGDLPGVIRVGHRFVCSVPALLAALGVEQ
jgi:hypothetical protein